MYSRLSLVVWMGLRTFIHICVDSSRTVLEHHRSFISPCPLPYCFPLSICVIENLENGPEDEAKCQHCIYMFTSDCTIKCHGQDPRSIVAWLSIKCLAPYIQRRRSGLVKVSFIVFLKLISILTRRDCNLITDAC